LIAKQRFVGDGSKRKPRLCVQASKKLRLLSTLAVYGSIRIARKNFIVAWITIKEPNVQVSDTTKFNSITKSRLQKKTSTFLSTVSHSQTSTHFLLSDDQIKIPCRRVYITHIFIWILK